MGRKDISKNNINEGFWCWGQCVLYIGMCLFLSFLPQTWIDPNQPRDIVPIAQIICPFAALIVSGQSDFDD